MANHDVLTPTPAGPSPRRRGKPGPPRKGLSTPKRKQAKTHPGHRHDESDHPFKTESWWAEGMKETSGKKPRLSQTRHPRKTVHKRGSKPTLK